MVNGRRVALVAIVLALPLFSGCLTTMDRYKEFNPDLYYENPGVFLGDYRFGNGMSLGIRDGNYLPSEPEIVRLISDRPAYPDPTTTVTTDATVYIPMAIWKPANFTGKMPVVVDAGPYYEVFDHCPFGGAQCDPADRIDDTIDWPGQSTPFLLQNMLPHGYAVVQLAVRGTGTHGGCMDLMGDDEQGDLDQAITWLGEQDWSNGNVAMMGVSYDGSTPWTVAATGNPHLKTIVPISGLPDWYDLMFHNGSAETRGAIMHSTDVYWSYGFDDDFVQNPGLPGQVPWFPPTGMGQANGRAPYQDLQNAVCPDAFEGQALGQVTSITGERHSAASAYWVERDHRDDVVANYKGSVFLIHGLQDWNVDPHAAIPFNLRLREAGLEVKEWYGQWGHSTADGGCAQAAPTWVTRPCRLDYADVLLRWFDRYLKDNMTVATGPPVQVQDNVGMWRNVDRFPPAEPAWLEFSLSGDGTMATKPGTPSTVQLLPPQTGGPSEIVEFVSEPLAEDLHLSGLAQLKLPFTVQGSGGEIGAWIMDMNEAGDVRAPDTAMYEQPPTWRPVGIPIIAHAQMNLRYYAGGEEPQTLAPNTRYTAQIEFEAFDVLVPKGHRLLMWVFQYSYPDHQRSYTPSPVTIELGPNTILRLPGIDADPVHMFPVPGAHFPNRDNLTMMYVPQPTFSSGTMAAAATQPFVAASQPSRVATCAASGQATQCM